jgi:hypothetical protein
VVALLAGYHPLSSRIPAGNRGDGTRPLTRDALAAPAELRAFDVQFRGGQALPYAAAVETFATLKAGFLPTAPPPGVVREQLDYEIKLNTRYFDTTEASDLYEDAFGAFLYAGPDLGLTVGGERPVKAWQIPRARVEDTAGTAADRPAQRGVASKQVVLTLRVTVELQITTRIPREV